MTGRFLMTGRLVAPLCLVTAACGERTGEGTADVAGGDRAGGIAVVCASAVPDALNAFVSPDLVASDLRMLLYTPLVLYDSAGGVRPYLAREWEWQDDQRRLVLRLRNDVRWHDGQPVSADDVAWTLLAAADSSYAYPSGADLAAVQDAVVRDSTTVEVLFSEPFVAGLEPFVNLPILPRHVLGAVPATEFARAPYHREPVGSGPFRFAGRTPDGSLQFDRVADFPEDMGRALLDRVVVRAVPEPSAMLIELQTGNIDMCVTGSSMARQVEESPQLDAVGLMPAGVQVIQLTTRTAPFTDARVRRAFSAALKRADLAASISPLAQPARTYLPAGAERWSDARLLQPDADSALAVALLDSAGWSRVGADGIRVNPANQPLRFTIAAPPPLQNLLTIVQAQLRSVGMDARLQFMEGTSFLAMIRNPAGRPQAIAISMFPEKFTLPDPRGQIHSRGSTNLTGYADPRADSLVDRLSSVLPDDERARIYHELQRRVAEDVPMVYTAYFPRVLAVGPRLENVKASLNGPFTSASGWWIPPAERRRGPAGSPRDSAAAAAPGAGPSGS